jgi:hypothetical protein
MEKIVIRRGQGTYGYEYVVVSSDGTENIVPLNKKTTDECLYLPENPMNRKYIAISKLEKNGGYIELSSKIGVEDYLSDEDKELYFSLIKKANEEKKRREEEAKNLSPMEKAQLEMKKAVAQCLKLGIDLSTLGIKI